jgi:hypothetical protein
MSIDYRIAKGFHLADDVAMECFKPLRNYLRKFNLTSMLQAIWFLSNHIEFKRELPQYLAQANPFGSRDWSQLGFFLWELDTLAREAIIHCEPVRGQPVDDWKHVREAINKLKWTEDQAIEADEQNVLAEVARTAHRQFHWQNGIAHDSFSRVRKIYRNQGMESVVRSVYGLSAEQVVMGGFALLATYIKFFGITTDWAANMSRKLHFDCAPIIENLTIDMAALRQANIEKRSLDEDWAYSFHPLWLHPMIRVEGGSRIICPLPGLLARRITDGLYFDVAGHDVDALSEHMGPAFQAYIGEAIERANGGSLRVFAEEKFGSKQQIKDTVDWIVQDHSGSLFIEVKLLKMGAAAKTFLARREAVTTQFKKLAKAIGQTYAALADALAGKYPNWKPDGRPVHPLIVTLDNWNLFTEVVEGELDQLVLAELDKRGLDRAVLQSHRYVVCCAQEFEAAIQVIDQLGIHHVLKDITDGANMGWLLKGHLNSAFSDALSKTRPLFPEERDNFLASVSRRGQ